MGCFVAGVSTAVKQLWLFLKLFKPTPFIGFYHFVRIYEHPYGCAIFVLILSNYILIPIAYSFLSGEIMLKGLTIRISEAPRILHLPKRTSYH